jgi:hypothetical protein
MKITVTIEVFDPNDDVPDVVSNEDVSAYIKEVGGNFPYRGDSGEYLSHACKTLGATLKYNIEVE